MSVLFFALRNSFQIKDKDVLYGQTCVEDVYGEIDTFVNAAIRSKSLQISGTTFAYPDKYFISLDKDTNSIQLRYQDTWGIITYRTLALTGNVSPSYYCQTSSYDIVLSGTNLDVTINKGLAQDQNLQSFILSGAGGFTWSVDFMQCESSVCKQIGQLVVDTRTQSVQKKLCLTLSGNVCGEWDK